MKIKDYKEDIEKLYEDFKHANSINKGNLFKILKDNADTYFGQKYDFSTINSLEEYVKRVPLTTFKDYKEKGNLYNYEVGYRLATSGTLGVQKKFTVSKLAMDNYGPTNFTMPFYLLNMKCEKGINCSVFRDPHVETLLSCALYDHLYTNGYFTLDNFYDGDFLFSQTAKNIPYIKMYVALAHKDVAFFDSIFLYDLLIIFKYMKDNWQLLLADIKNHVITPEVSDEDRKNLLKVVYSKERIAEIEQIFNEGFDTPIIKKLFPELRFVSGVGGGKYEIYDAALKEFIGDTPMFYYIFAQTECSFGVPLEMNKAEYAMIPRTCFMEYRDMQNGEVLLANQLTIGKEYEPIVTTFSGLYRYLTGDKVELVSYIDESPIVRIKSRINSIINIAGEKVDEADITLAMNNLKDKYDFNQFGVGIDSSVYPNRYVLFVESSKKQDGFANDFDKQIRKLSFDYDELRDREMINNPIVINKTTEDFKNIQKGQIKPKVVLATKLVEEWLNEKE